jgi:hypothetical protein
LLRLTDEIPGWSQSGICDYEDFEQYLILQDVLKESQSSLFKLPFDNHMSESGYTRQTLDDDDDDE